MAGSLNIVGERFRDSHGRHVLLRGVNLGGDSKVPSTPDGHTHLPTDFLDHRAVSFVGRPAPVDEIDSHLARLRHWGFNCIRLLTTWEAVAHAGPGERDEAYLDYFAEVCRRAGDYGFWVFVDFHQDVWSRMSGGDGAPGWTFEAAGLDFTSFHAADAALVMNHNYDHLIGGRQPSYPRMSWSSNYSAPACAVMFTLFFGGRDFAPQSVVDGKNIQDFLQNDFLGSMRAVAERVSAMPHVIGFETLNEPSLGFIGKAFDQRSAGLGGLAWSPLDALAAASGFSRELPVMEAGVGQTGTRRVNPDRVSIWLPGRTDPFRDCGAWDVDSDGNPFVRQPEYFNSGPHGRVAPPDEYLVHFFNRVACAVRAVRPDWFLFLEIDPFEALSGHAFPENCPERAVNASHWYDLASLATKRFDVKHSTNILSNKVRSGRCELEADFMDELTRIMHAGRALNRGAAPTLIGECGIQFDMNNAEAYSQWANGNRDPSIWESQSTALDLMYNAFDRLLLSSTQWNYTVSNRNDPMIGDGWNQEDLSIWSADQVIDDDPGAGGRAVSGFCRPYVRSAQGSIISQAFNRDTGHFEARIDADPEILAETEIYVPVAQFPNGCTITTNAFAVSRVGDQMVWVRSLEAAPLTITLQRK